MCGSGTFVPSNLIPVLLRQTLSHMRQSLARRLTRVRPRKLPILPGGFRQFRQVESLLRSGRNYDSFEARAVLRNAVPLCNFPRDRRAAGRRRANATAGMQGRRSARDSTASGAAAGMSDGRRLRSEFFSACASERSREYLTNRLTIQHLFKIPTRERREETKS